MAIVANEPIIRNVICTKCNFRAMRRELDDCPNCYELLAFTEESFTKSAEVAQPQNLSDVFWKEINGKHKINQHELNFYVQDHTNDLQSADAIYDVINDTWIKSDTADEEVDISNIQEKYPEAYAKAEEYAKKFDSAFGLIRRLVSDELTEDEYAKESSVNRRLIYTFECEDEYDRKYTGRLYQIRARRWETEDPEYVSYKLTRQLEGDNYENNMPFAPSDQDLARNNETPLEFARKQLESYSLRIIFEHAEVTSEMYFKLATDDSKELIVQHKCKSRRYPGAIVVRVYQHTSGQFTSYSLTAELDSVENEATVARVTQYRLEVEERSVPEWIADALTSLQFEIVNDASVEYFKLASIDVITNAIEKLKQVYDKLHEQRHKGFSEITDRTSRNYSDANIVWKLLDHWGYLNTINAITQVHFS